VTAHVRAASIAVAVLTTLAISGCASSGNVLASEPDPRHIGFRLSRGPACVLEKASVSVSLADQLTGKYAKCPTSTSGGIDEFSYSEIAHVLGDPGKGTYTNKGFTTVDGQSVVNLQYSGTSITGHVYVAASGTPYPVLLDHLNGSGSVTLSGWDEGSAPKTPKNIVKIPTG
jgi:hypothetical protein